MEFGKVKCAILVIKNGKRKSGRNTYIIHLH